MRNIDNHILRNMDNFHILNLNRAKHEICCDTCKHLIFEGDSIQHIKCGLNANECLTIGMNAKTYYNWPRNPRKNLSFVLHGEKRDYALWEPLYPYETLPEELFEI